MAVTYVQTVVFTASDSGEYALLKAAAVESMQDAVTDDDAMTVTVTAVGETLVS